MPQLLFIKSPYPGNWEPLQTKLISPWPDQNYEWYITTFIWLADGPIDDRMYSSSTSVILRSACGVSATMYHHIIHHINASIPEIMFHVCNFQIKTKFWVSNSSKFHVSVNKIKFKIITTRKTYKNVLYFVTRIRPNCLHRGLSPFIFV